MDKPISLLYNKASLKSYADKICQKFNLAYADKNVKGWFLFLDELGLSLHEKALKQHISIHLDDKQTDYRRRFSNGRQQALSKAVGLDKPRSLHIMDVTAGFGKDAFMMANLGANLHLIERNPAMAALLFDALYRASLNTELTDIIDKMQLVHANAIHYLNDLAENDCPDIIYMDPMYPERKKSALVKKNMQAAHEIVGKDADADELLSSAIEKAKKRVVVKRPKGAEHLGVQKPNAQIQSKNTRYDIYTISKLD